MCAVATWLNRELVNQTRRELNRLRTEIGTWIALRRKKTNASNTQLDTLESQCNFILCEIGRSLGTISLAPPPWQAYADCRKGDRRLLWVRRLWSYFRSKFDQRDSDDTGLKLTLAAADDAVWSCYVQPFRSAKRTPMPVRCPMSRRSILLAQCRATSRPRTSGPKAHSENLRLSILSPLQLREPT